MKAKTNVIYLEDYRMAKACQEAGKRLDDHDRQHAIENILRYHDAYWGKPEDDD